MITKDNAIAIATVHLPKKYEKPQFLQAVYSDSLEEFGQGVSGWRVWFRLVDSDFGTYDRPVEVCESTGKAKLVKVML
ncbi:hypothetical protein DSM3645_26149 [Blastopirellula marina DSM 3645]|uniref:Uncharacterized protein n=1 Tax=Blastopirellula marina DSM 3645 TaxID=314230 RepID=A3ZWE3_9BACT|nr:hypothetical protein DSM3645_16015 [Blastopirellula marina DSM 3645]EAQ79171.1 hypothetical protein DSM3645_26149 [Blastopirellula marina DSM 3645]